MKKVKLFINSLIVASILAGVSVTGTVLAKEQPEGKPFKEIWQAINNLQTEMSALTGRILALENWKATIEEWKTEIETWKSWVNEKLNNTQTEMSALTGRILALENWKATIEEWKTEIETWKSWVNEKLELVQEEITDLGNRVSILEAPATLLEKIKNVDGSGSGLDADLLDGYDSSEFLSVPWTRLTNFPNNCPAGQYVYGLGGTLKCGTPTSGISGSGLDNYIPRWNGTSALENSIIYQTDSGNVGISTTAPRRSLDVNGEIVAVNRLTMAQDMSRTTLTWHLDNYGGRFRIFNQPNIDTPGVERLTILNSNGNVGIGTAWPDYKLDVNGDIRSTGYLRGVILCIGSDCRTSWPTGIGGSGAINYITKFTGSTSVGNSIIYDNGTNVGIGTTTPTAKLEVNGNVKINNGGLPNRVVCWKSDGKTLGYCSTQPNENGECTCN